MLFRRPSAPALLGLGAAVAGLVGVVSALTPEFADRFDLVRGILPPGVPEAARVLALSLGLALIWLSRSLARRKRRGRPPAGAPSALPRAGPAGQSPAPRAGAGS